MSDSTNVSGYPIDMQFVFPHVTAFDWTQYYIDIPVSTDPTAKALEVRLHVYSRFTGTVYFDDLGVQVIGNTTAVKNRGDLPAYLRIVSELSEFRSTLRPPFVTASRKTDPSRW